MDLQRVKFSRVNLTGRTQLLYLEKGPQLKIENVVLQEVDGTETGEPIISVQQFTEVSIEGISINNVEFDTRLLQIT